MQIHRMIKRDCVNVRIDYNNFIYIMHAYKIRKLNIF